MNKINTITPIRPVPNICEIKRKSSRQDKNNKKKKNKNQSNKRSFKKDLLTISSEINNECKKHTYSNISTKKNFLAIDSLSKEIISFIKLNYVIYKEEHFSNSPDEINNQFHSLAKKGVQLGLNELNKEIPLTYNNIRKYLKKVTYRTMQKIDTQFPNSTTNLKINVDIHGLESTKIIKDFVYKTLKNIMKC